MRRRYHLSSSSARTSGAAASGCAQEHRSTQGRSGGVNASPQGLHPWKGLGDGVRTIQIRALALLDGLGKTILKFPC